VRAPLRLSDAEVVNRLDALLRDAVGLQMAADVPLGAFLSGGVDSSTVVALMQAQATRPVRTFTIGNTVAGFDEAGHARAVARHLGTEHTELYVTADDARAVIPDLPRFYDEPFADSSQIPTYLVSRLAREHVTVALSGDGGDELFAGYNRHVLGDRLWKRLRPVPYPVRRAVARALSAVPAEMWDRGARALGGRSAGALVGYKLHKLADVLDADSADRVYLRLVSHWKRPTDVVLGASEPLTLVTDPTRRPTLPGFTERMMYLDSVTYLPDDILTKVDRASMAVSLEVRVPLLDHRVYEFAWALPLHQKLRAGHGKWALRQVLYRYVPPALFDRPKSGFGVPIGEWLRGPLRDWAEALLAPDRLRDDGFFDVAAVRSTWETHLARRADLQYHLWDVLMFQAWYHDGGRAA
jgi:asparagine synthase (glutamine-hydrolysing)